MGCCRRFRKDCRIRLLAPQRDSPQGSAARVSARGLGIFVPSSSSTSPRPVRPRTTPVGSATKRARRVEHSAVVVGAV
jgi:hypothetical protein